MRFRVELRRTALALLTSVLLLASGYARNGKGLSVQKSTRTPANDEGSIIADSLIVGYVSRLARNIARASDLPFPLTIEIIESKEINASVRAGHYLYVNTGVILASDDETELAGILAHEIAHLNGRHDRKIQRRRKIWRIASLCAGPAGLPVEIAGFLSSMKSQRDAEREADWLALRYQDAAGYDPDAFLSFLEKVRAIEAQDYTTLGKPFATHPPIQERIRRAQKEISAQLRPQVQYIIDTSEFEQMKLRLSMLIGGPPHRNLRNSVSAHEGVTADDESTSVTHGLASERDH